MATALIQVKEIREKKKEIPLMSANQTLRAALEEMTKKKLGIVCVRENRFELYESCIQFLKTRIKLDQSGFAEDIFKH